MTAFSVGRSVASEGGFALNNADGGNGVTKALGMITALIPAEALAAFLATISAIAAIPNAPDVQEALNVWLALPMGIIATVLFAYVGAADRLIGQSGAALVWKLLKILFYALGISLLFLVYVAAMPDNPIQARWGIPSAYGGLLAVVLTILWGGIKALIDAFRAKPE